MKNDLTIAKIKHTDFAELYDKFIIGKKLNQKQYETLLAIAICFTNADDINVQQWGYRIVVEYCNQTQDYMPLYEIAINKGLYPVSKFIERHYIDDDQRNFFTEWNDAFTEQYISGDICRSEQQDALIKFFEKKYNNTISISAPTSYGKSELILSTIKEYKGRKICVLTSTKALLTQTKKRIQQISKGIFPKVVVHPEMYNSKDVSCLAVLTQERLLRVLKKDPALAFDCIIVDEAHEILENNARKKWLENTYDYKAIGAEIREKIRTYTRFIWYEINGDVKPEIIFTNINMGKIKLTNAELIKALLLKKDNYKGESEKEITASQIKISTAWDNMEATLQREDMWRFLTGSGKFSSIDTHMELIFQIMANEIIKSRVEKYPEFYIENEKQLNRETYTFIIFNREIEYMKREYVDVGDYKYSKMLEDFWGKVESFYNMFIDWYEDREWYHLIGVLLSKDENQSEEYFENLCNLYRGHTKTEFVMELKKKIISEIEFEDTDKDDFEFGEEVVREYLNSLQYSGKKAEKNKIKNMLLLFNVISMQQNTDSNPRFPFDAYQRQKWDIEHIHSVTTDRAQNKKEREEWLEEAKPYIDSEVGMPEDLKAEIDNIYTKKLYEDESAPQYDEMYNKVIAFFSGESSVEEKPINEISNLTLLDQRTNRGYGNHIFPVKRNKILEKSGIESFIPLCTKNVFLKFYSKTVSQMYLWDKHDRQDYFDKMVQTIVDYLAEDIEDMKEEI